MKAKLLHQTGVPAIPVWCFDMSDCNDGFPPLVLCPWDDLVKVAEALAPLVNGERTLKFDGFASAYDMKFAISVVELQTAAMLGGVLNEMKRRKRIKDADYEREWNETHAKVMARLNEKREALRGRA